MHQFSRQTNAKGGGQITIGRVIQEAGDYTLRWFHHHRQVGKDHLTLSA